MDKNKKIMIDQLNIPMNELVSEKRIIIFWSNTTGSLAQNHFVPKEEKEENWTS